MAHYEGKFVAEFLPDGRKVKLVEPFAYVDDFTVRWEVPAGWIVDGASIPQALWTFVGSPFTGLYREASVIHDFYCDVRLHTWGAVHRVFYDAMVTSGVGPIRANIMYGAVVWGGPRWSNDALKHRLQTEAGHEGLDFPPSPDFPEGLDSFERSAIEDGLKNPPLRKLKVQQFPFDENDLKALEANLASRDLPPEKVAAYVEEQIATRKLAPHEETVDFATPAEFSQMLLARLKR